MARGPLPNQFIGFSYGTRAERRNDLDKRKRSVSRARSQRGRSKVRFENQFPPLKITSGDQETAKGLAPAWNIFRGSAKLRTEKALKFFEPNPRTSEEDPFIIVPTEVVARETKKWESYLVAYVVGKRPHFPALKSTLEAQWRLRGPFQMHSLPEGFFLFKFFDNFDRLRVLEEGPWSFYGRPLVIKEWKRGLELKQDQFNVLPIWVRLPNLDFRLWDNEAIGRISSVIGQPKFVDEQTANRERLAYARVCVEINPLCDYPRKINILVGTEWITQQFRYEWKPFSCDHNEDFCPVKGVSDTASLGKQDQGHWMTVGKGAPGSRKRGDKEAQGISNSKSILEGTKSVWQEKSVRYINAKSTSSNCFLLLHQENMAQSEEDQLEEAIPEIVDGDVSSKDSHLQQGDDLSVTENLDVLSAVPETGEGMETETGFSSDSEEGEVPVLKEPVAHTVDKGDGPVEGHLNPISSLKVDTSLGNSWPPAGITLDNNKNWFVSNCPKDQELEAFLLVSEFSRIGIWVHELEERKAQGPSSISDQ